jgi:8-oxo-dGTP diphosphatase
VPTQVHLRNFFVPFKTIDGITSSVIPFCIEDAIVFVLLGQRIGTSHAFANAWGLIGGFLNPGIESLQECAVRELKEETGLDVAAESMKLVTVQSDPTRDPRGQIIDTVWSTHLNRRLVAVAADDVQAIAWQTLSHALTMELAFDHQSSLHRFAAIFAHHVVEQK